MLKSIKQIIALLSFGVVQAVSADESLVFAVHPYVPALELQKRFTPLIDHLSQSVGRHIVIKVSPSYQVHIDRVVKGEIDIAYLGPASFVKAYLRQPELHTLARLEVNGEPFFHGKIVTNEASGIRKLDDLKGKSFAFGDKNSTMSHLVPRYSLTQHGVMDELSKYKFLGSHNNVALGVLLGKYDAGAVKESVYLNYKERGLHLLHDTDAISEHLFVASKRVSKDWAIKIRDSLLSTRQKVEVLKSIKPSITNLVEVNPSDYDNLRTIMFELKVLDDK